jgi:hypothetical protein
VSEQRVLPADVLLDGASANAPPFLRAIFRKYCQLNLTFSGALLLLWPRLASLLRLDPTERSSVVLRNLLKPSS